MKAIRQNINNYIIYCTIVLLASGCAAVKSVPVVNMRALLQGEATTAKTGDIFFTASPGNNVPNDKTEKFSLSVIELNEREMILKYIDSVGGELLGGNKRSIKTFTYPVNEKKLKFMEFEFQILLAGDKEIRYKRNLLNLLQIY